MNKTPIQELIYVAQKMLDVATIEKNKEMIELFISFIETGLQKEKQFAFDCFEAGGLYQEAKFGYDYMERGITHDADDFEQFYSQYAEQHKK